jgi:hypothetical protein
MTIPEITACRLINQQIAETKFRKPQEIVSWLVAMQSQEYAMAKWAIGLRLPGFSEAGIEKAFNEGAILRTHLMRPTWHFVTPADIRWMLALTAPRVNALNAYMYRKMELNDTIFKRSNNILIKALQGGKHLTRIALNQALERAKIKADGIRLGLLMMRAELDGIICSGPRQGKQFTYALLGERVPKAGAFSREEALAAFVLRYFTSRGPATLQDFVYWSGLTMKDAKEGLAAYKSKLANEKIEGQEYFFAAAPKATRNLQRVADLRKNKLQTSFLMPDYDEYGMSYKNRSALINADTMSMVNRGESGFNHMIVIDGLIEGAWKRIVKNNTVEIETSFFNPLNKTKQQAVKQAVKQYCSFFDL